MNKTYEKLLKCCENIKARINPDFIPKIALVLGSGLGNYADHIETVNIIDYSSIDGFPQSTVAGHKGRFIFGYDNGVPVVIMQGRVHFYEGYEMSDVVLPIRLMKMLGAEVLFLTNASGGINKNFKAGDFMLITDHISNFVKSSLIGENIDELGARFPDMSEVYDKSLRDIIKNTAEKNDIELQEGVYIQLTGPNYETPAEVRMCGILGADAVGMSTVCEAMAANHMGMKICGISCISNMASGISETPLNHKEVQETADRKAPLFRKLVSESIKEIYKSKFIFADIDVSHTIYFHELIKKCDIETIVQKFLLLCKDASDSKLTGKKIDINVIEKKIRNAIITINEIKPNKSDTGILIIEKVPHKDWTEDNVYLLDTSDGETYAIECTPWADILGYKADEKSLSLYGYEEFVTLVLWEITWFGFDEESIQKEIKSWFEDSDE